ncbi:hemolysin family protein [Stutzerimonas tarimensis]|uniref:Hemolysin family protein n=1 Tax=Stutzerimonas tarimensis TaxID=1507735 RepID=A0ABV7T5N0_9GAMM
MDPYPGYAASSFFGPSGLMLAALLLLSLNAFFVAAGFALIRLRSADTPVDEHRYAPLLRSVRARLDTYLSACQLGISLASLALGWIAAPALAGLFEPLLSGLGISSPAVVHGVALGIAFLSVALLHILLGERWPRLLAIKAPARLSLWSLAPLWLFYWLSYPALALLNLGSRQAQTPAANGRGAELNLAVERDPADRETRVLASAAEMAQLDVVDWINSREDLVYLERKAPLEEVFSLFRRHKYSRYPIFDESIGEFTGILHIKDLLLHLSLLEMLPSALKLDDLAHPIERISKHMPLAALLEQFRQGRSHFALVEEADGKVIGYLTMEDVLEALVGDIQDEHRKAERGVVAYQPGKLLVRGDTPLFKVERLLGINLDHIEADTLAGLIYDSLKRMPEEDEVLEVAGLRIILKKMRGPKVVLAKVLRVA